MAMQPCMRVSTLATGMLLLSAALGLAAANESPSGCVAITAPTTSSGGCLQINLTTLPPGPFTVHDSYPMPYVVTTPCLNLTQAQTNCSSFAGGDDAGTPVYAVAGAAECYALGHTPMTSATLLDPANPGAGMIVELDGGVGGRVLKYAFTCDPSAPLSAGPTNATQEHGSYTIHWPTSLACQPVAVGCNEPAVPRPTADQLAFQEMEFGALVCYNMATTTGTQGCPAHSVPPVSAFTEVAPADVDTDGWCQAIKSFGGRYATLVAKHVCGFAIWPTKAGLPDRNWTYEYHVPADRDIVQAFVTSCQKVGVKLGIYYSVVSNEYLNVANGLVRPQSTLGPGQVAVTQEEYASIVVQQLTELWSHYGDLAEIWFECVLAMFCCPPPTPTSFQGSSAAECLILPPQYHLSSGGFAVPSLEPQLLALLNRTQPHACIFNGCGLSPNAVAWIGTESGHAPYPVWNTQDGCPSGAGTPYGTNYVPKEVDLTLQNADTWFYRESTGYRSLADMASIYHDSVGHGGNMLLNIAPPPNSTLPVTAVRRYAALGHWISTCYGTMGIAAPSALATTKTPCVNCSKVRLQVDSGTGPRQLDRFLLKEDLRNGQLVMKFTISVDSTVVFNGSAIGRTLIVILPANVTGSVVTLEVQSARAPPTIRLFAVPNPSVCSITAAAESCSYVNDTLYLGPVKGSSTEQTVAACCQKCREDLACAVFTFYQNTCSLIIAQQGSKAQPGAVSGSPA